MHKPELDIFFYHIFKCGGTTFNWLLQENFPDKVIYAESPINSDKPISKNSLEKALQKFKLDKKKIKAVSSHNISSECYSLAKLPFTLIRHPMNRNWSAFNHINKNKKLSFEDYLKINNNFQTKLLSIGRDLKDEKLILIILDRLRVGILERFDESMVYLESLGEILNINLDLSYSKKFNKQIYKKRTQYFKSPDNLIQNQTLKDLFYLDFQLYNYANKKLNEELKKITNFEEKLLDFKKRCDYLKKISYRGKRNNYGQNQTSFYIIE